MPWAGKAARVRETTIASLAVVMKIGNAIVIHIDVETEIGTEAVNTEKGDAGLKKVQISMFSEEKRVLWDFIASV